MIDAKEFLEALDALENEKGISKVEIVDALKEALRKAYVKMLGGGDDADVRVSITEDPAAIDMCRVRKVVKEVQDDYLEIDIDEANATLKKGQKKYAEGDEFVEPVDVSELKRMTALTVKSILKQKLAEAEKRALYETHKDKVGELITGIVERFDDRGATINIGRASITLPRKELIGDESYPQGATIRLYVSDVTSNEKGSMIRVTRSDAGYLKCLFEESVREIYDGTIVIKNIARDAGLRSKVAVYSNDPNVDCIGSCIGIGGKAIQSILSQLGNGTNREKVDLVLYSPNDALYIVDALRPGQVKKLYLDEENHKAVAIIPDGTLSVAIGRKGSNARVASKLTGYDIDIKEESDADELGLEFKTVEQLQIEDRERVQKDRYNAYLAQLKAQKEAESQLSTGLDNAKPHTISDEEIEEEPVKEEVKPVVEAVKEEAPVVEEVKPVEPKQVKTTTTLESLEAALESDKKKESFKATQKTSRRPKTITESEVEHDVEAEKEIIRKGPQMDIYTKEELEELENEEYYEDEYDDSDEDIDYDEFDSYYDDDNN